MVMKLINGLKNLKRNKMKQETLEEAADAIETKYTNGKRNNFKYDIDWVKYILWTIICVCFGMVLGMFTTKLIYGL
jgi:energy-coupling factor transporter transmembrane protein EcfT